MLSYTTNGIYSPWTINDVKRYEEEGSQRDKVIYNSAYNSRIELTDKNVYLCSIPQKNNIYRNFYLLGVTRSKFYLMMYVPQLEPFRDSEVRNSDFVRKCLDKLPLTKQSSSSFESSVDYNENIKICDGCSFLIKVDASIEEFLFPKYKKITNFEISKKYKLMNNVYAHVMKEHEAFMTAIDKYSKACDEREKKIKSKLTKMVVRRGIMVGVTLFTGIPLFDIDSLFGLEDLADMADLADNISMIDILNVPTDLMA